jgi:very-short-patch-repair endonuclease
VRLKRIGIAMQQQVVIDGHAVDGRIGKRLLMLVDGYGPHSAVERRRRDLRQDARLTLMGYTVLRFDYAQILFDWPFVESSILAAMAQGSHLWSRGATRSARHKEKALR